MSVSWTVSAFACVVLAMCVCVCSADGSAPNSLAGSWSSHQGRASFLFESFETKPGSFNISFSMRHGPSNGVATVSGSNIDLTVYIYGGRMQKLVGHPDSNFSYINWTSPTGDKPSTGAQWCRAWTDGCLSPTPPYPKVFTFDNVFGSNMVLQQEPAMAAVYGKFPPGTSPSATATVTVTSDGGESYTVNAVVNKTHIPQGPDNLTLAEELGWVWPGPYQTWKALLKPTKAGGNYTITAKCSGCFQADQYNNATITNVTFGDMWFCSGQSNMWLPVDHSFSRNDTLHAITNENKYHNIRLVAQGSGTSPIKSGYDYSQAWMTALQASAVTGRPAEPAFFKMGASCWYFAQKLTDLLESQGKVVPIGIVDTAIGGQRIEEYMDNATIGVCKNRTAPGKWDGPLFASMVVPFVDMTIKGIVWYQGENNMGAIKGNSIDNIGYGCEQRELVRGWRRIWSSTPGTTAPDAAFGVVTLASSGSEGGPNMGAMRYAQTANYGILPNAAMPNTFLAQAYDLQDIWGPRAGPCYTEWHCCPYDPKTCNATTAKLCQASCAGNDDTPIAMGGIHPRNKKPVGDRLGTAAFNVVYGGKVPMSGPTLSSCSVSGNSLSIKFNETILAGDKVKLNKYNRGRTLSQLQVQTNASNFCVEPLNGPNGKYCPSWAGGPSPPNATVGEGWISLNITSTDGSGVAVDLTPLNGTSPTAVRYAWGIINCCDPDDALLYVTHPCLPSCPISSGSGLPANPFIAQIVGGSCQCVAPQKC
eukprot:m.154374 g.154374  ORF g.154374 m.154374 type:complete len:759 (-) comp17497_c1_seq1:23-2299(-)